MLLHAFNSHCCIDDMVALNCVSISWYCLQCSEFLILCNTLRSNSKNSFKTVFWMQYHEFLILCTVFHERLSHIINDLKSTYCEKHTKKLVPMTKYLLIQVFLLLTIVSFMVAMWSPATSLQVTKDLFWLWQVFFYAGLNNLPTKVPISYNVLPTAFESYHSS